MQTFCSIFWGGINDLSSRGSVEPGASNQYGIILLAGSLSPSPESLKKYRDHELTHASFFIEIFFEQTFHFVDVPRAPCLSISQANVGNPRGGFQERKNRSFHQAQEF